MSEGSWSVRANGVWLCVETFGEARDPAILLIGGATADMEWIDRALCQRLADGGRFVIRYDHRDTGDSTKYELGNPQYGFDEMVADAAALLEAIAVPRAHIAGMSMGGAIAQRLALDYDHLVETLTLISTSPALRPCAPPYPDLPAMSPELAELFSGPDAAPGHNHWMIDPGEDYRARLRHIAAPALVIHGMRDPLFPPGHGAALAREIPGSRLLLLDGVGHEMAPPERWDEVIQAMLRHTADAATGA
ncbi:alpha/beta hydrolase [Dactylosporangium sp. NPDC000555]|uniref:alpha/beta fold hydrolase n=1 Tax=Dactylosporangium sp. NPDC000555 TaxID=3154260 RepID=UPI00332458BB